MTMLVESYVGRPLARPAGDRIELLNAVTAEPVAVVGTDPIDLVPVLDHAQIRRRTGTAGAALPRAGSDPQGARQPPERQTGTVLRHLGLDRGDQAGLDGRHRRRHRGAVHLRRQGPPGTAELHRAGRRSGRTARQDRPVRRPAHLHPAPRGGAADQRLQLPGLGDAGEARAGVPGRGADRRQAGIPDLLPGRGRGPGDHRLRAAAGGQPATRHRRVQRVCWTC